MCAAGSRSADLVAFGSHLPCSPAHPEVRGSRPATGADYCTFTDFFETCVGKYDFTVGNGGRPLGEASNWWNEVAMASPDSTCEAAPFEVGSAFINQLPFMEDNASRIADASELVGAHSLIDFLGRTENLTAHFEEALVAAGKPSIGHTTGSIVAGVTLASHALLPRSAGSASLCTVDADLSPVVC